MKIKQFVSLISVAVVLFTSCGQRQEKKEVKEEKLNAEMEFFNRFKSLEGKSFSGKVVFVGEGVSSWADLELVMTVRE